jgi:hypothetical protein
MHGNGSFDSGKGGGSTSTGDGRGVLMQHHTLEPIQSVQTASEEDVAAATAEYMARSQGGFTQEQLEEAMKKVGTT